MLKDNARNAFDHSKS